jgi:transposase
MYIEKVPNRNSPPAILLREAWREAGKIKKRTVANLSHWPAARVAALQRLLKDEPLAFAADAFAVERSVPHGNVRAVLGALKKLGVDALLAAKRSRRRDLAVALIAARLLHPGSKLATTRQWETSTLAEELGVADADEDELYAAMDWLLDRQTAIEPKLAARHLTEGGFALYDVTSSYYEGRACPLARFGHNRDGKRDRPIIVYGLLTDAEGRPVGVDVYPGNTGDPTTVPDQVAKLQERWGLSRVVLVGDRGMVTETQIETLREHPGLGWISALRSGAIRKLVDGGALQLSLFDQRNLAEIAAPEYPGERLVACFNPLLADERRRKREDLLAATEKDLAKIAAMVARRTKSPLKGEEIAMKVGKVINQHKMAKHFHLDFANGAFAYRRNEPAVAREAELDGVYVIRTSEPADRLSAENTVRRYKSLAQVEQAFRCAKGLDLLVRPIFHHEDRRVRAHIFLCLLAYYVEWHMRRDLAPLLFEDEELESERRTRDPVAKAEPSASVRRKKRTKRTADGLPVHSFRTLLDALATQCRNRCRIKSQPDAPTFDQLTEPTPLQQRAYDLLGV